MIVLRDQMVLAAPVALRDHARGSATVGIDGGTMAVTVTGVFTLPPVGPGGFSLGFSAGFNRSES